MNKGDDMQAGETTTKSALVTGAVNAVGREVTRKLVAAGYRVTGAVSGSAEATLLRQDGGLPAFPDLTRAGEIKSALAAAQADVVVHLAPQAPNHVPQIKTDWDGALRLLESGTPALLSAAAAAGVKLIVLVSYAFAGEAAPAAHDGDEEDAEPALVEAARAAEEAVLSGPAPACVLRAGYYYGAHSPATIALRDALRGNRPLALGGEHSVANWIHLDDLAAAVVAALDRRPTGALLDVVDDHPASPAEFAAYLARSLHVNEPGRMPDIAVRLMFGKTQIELLERSVRASNARAREALGWAPRLASYREGIDQTLLVLRAEEPVR